MLGLAIGVFVMVFGSITAFGYRRYAKPRLFQEQLDSMALGDQPRMLEEAAAPQGKWFVRVVQTIGEKVPISPQDASMQRRYLISAGYRSDRALKILYGTKLAFAAIGLFVGILAFQQMDNPVLNKVILVAAPALSFFLPNLVLDKLIQRRREKIRFALPDALDLMVVCMEAGLGQDQAIANVSRELRLTHPEITDELNLVTLEMRAGKRRSDALRNLADRTGEPELRKLVATMLQADRFGTGVGESLRTHSEFMRVKRRQEAEERAAKIGVKLVFPIFFFILPAMLLVSAGPGLLMLYKNLFPLLDSMGQ